MSRLKSIHVSKRDAALVWFWPELLWNVFREGTASFCLWSCSGTLWHTSLQGASAASIQSKVQHIIKWGLVCQKQVSRTWISNHIPQIPWDVTNYACLRCQLLAHRSIIYCIFTYQLWHVFAWKVISIWYYPAASMIDISNSNSNSLLYQHIKPNVFHDDEISC